MGGFLKLHQFKVSKHHFRIPKIFLSHYMPHIRKKMPEISDCLEVSCSWAITGVLIQWMHGWIMLKLILHITAEPWGTSDSKKIQCSFYLEAPNMIISCSDDIFIS